LPALRVPGTREAPSRASALGLKALVLISLSVGVMLVAHRQHPRAVVRQVLSAAVYPLQMLVHSPLAAWDWTRARLAERTSLLADNATLRGQLRDGEVRLLRLQAVEAENLRMRALLNAAPRDVEKARLAVVLRVDLDPLRQRVLVDLGTRDGVARGQAVIDGRGIVGQVSNVGPLVAEVILLSDPAHAVPVQVERNGLRTIAVGTGTPERLLLPYLPRNADIAVDDRLVSSGLGGVFPAGYPVGRVSSVRRDPAQPLANVSAVPAAPLDREREVLLLWIQPRVPAAAAELPAPSAAPGAKAAVKARPRAATP
jgi:rod shape-determining protein MreC